MLQVWCLVVSWVFLQRRLIRRGESGRRKEAKKKGGEY